MSFRKSISLSGLVIILSFTSVYGQEYKILQQPERLNGRVKAITEFYPFKKGNKRIKKNIRTDFYSNRHFEGCYVIGNTGNETIDSSFKYFEDKYVNPEKEVDTTGKILVGIFDKDGEHFGNEYILKEIHFKKHSMYCKAKYKHGTTETTYNNIVELDIYNSNDSIVFKQHYLYNKNHLIIEADNYLINGILTDKIKFKYLSYDKKGNWTKRVKIQALSSGKIIKTIYSDRQITYY